jgi:uncharacterized repeat protein (TIGR01451 family)
LGRCIHEGGERKGFGEETGVDFYALDMDGGIAFSVDKIDEPVGKENSVGTLTSPATLVTLEKTVNQETASPGDTLAYTLDFTNDGAEAVGNPALGIPLVIQDAIPANTSYVGGSAAAGNTLPAGVGAYNIFYSTDGGLNWSATEPATPATVTHIQWWLSDPLAAGQGGTVTFSVTIDNPPAGPLVAIPNTAGLSFGNTTPFLEDTVVTRVLGNNTLSGKVFVDDGAGAAGRGGSVAKIAVVTCRPYRALRRGRRIQGVASLAPAYRLLPLWGRGRAG